MRLSAGFQKTAIQMKMIGVGGVVAGAKSHPEKMTGFGMDAVQERGLGCRAVPVFFNGNGSAIVECQTGDVDGVGGCVLAAEVLPEFVANDVAAGIRAEVLDRADPLAEVLHCRWLNGAVEPHRKGGSRFARDGFRADAGARCGRDFYCVLPTAAVFIGLVFNG